MTGSRPCVVIVLALLAALSTTPAAAELAGSSARDVWFASDLVDWIAAHIPPTQIAIGMLIGLVAGEVMRIAWRTLEWLLFTVFVFAKVAARYGALAAIVGCVLYFI